MPQDEDIIDDVRMQICENLSYLAWASARMLDAGLQLRKAEREGDTSEIARLDQLAAAYATAKRLSRAKLHESRRLLKNLSPNAGR